ncbi:MAG: hypothetical protein JNM29_04150 [Candidatus Odyssella sp.]|nr:hypothetical protein [Candidatus Odyssella sp.]
MRRRVIALWLDGFDVATAEAMMRDGRMPALARLRAQGRRFALDHFAARATALGGEHASTGLAPRQSRRFGQLHFDAQRYAVWQEGAHFPPFFADLGARAVVLDACYCDLAQAPETRGLVAWGAHDPGHAPFSRPAGLQAEIAARFGPYPSELIYSVAWYSAARTRALGEDLARAVDLRADVACWLLGERLPDWDFAFVAAGEPHTITEACWHGVDSGHRLHSHASAPAARDALAAVYAAVDRLVGRIARAFPDATLAVWANHGMGPNVTDLPSMVLLPELLFRWQFGRAMLTGRPEWDAAPDGVPRLEGTDTWPGEIAAGYDPAQPRGGPFRPPGIADADFERARKAPWPDDGSPVLRQSIAYQPPAWYRLFWPRMRAFAIPAFEYGRVRINRAGREAQGSVRWRNGAVSSAVERLVRGCRDLHTGTPVVDDVIRVSARAARALGPTECDVSIFWRGMPVGFVHPRLGRIGPVPFHRTGGHTGGHGALYLAGAGIVPGDGGAASAFDVAPTLLDLLGERTPARLGGTSLLPRLAPAAPAYAAR